VLFTSPKNVEERQYVAGTCVRKLGISFPPCSTDSTIRRESLHGLARPPYLVDAKGRIAYKSKPGPFGFKPEELRAMLERAAGHLPLVT